MAMPASAAISEKSPEAFRTISEVALELDMPQHVLRFWESRFTQVRPIKRAGGRRYYRPEDVDLLRGIRTLLYREGFTIKGAQKVLRDKGLRYVAELGRAAFASGVPPSNIVVFETPRDDDAPVLAEVELAEVELAEVELADVEVDDVEVDDEPRYARAAQAMVERAHGAMASALAQEERTKLEALLSELLEMKARLLAAR
jgi:DNA-binding transcriptional MerR regulator